MSRGDEYAEPRGVEYLTHVPDAHDVPDGWIVVHNVTYTGQALGAQGFRAWLRGPDADRGVVEVCQCAFAPGVPVHYRRARVAT